MTGSPIQAAGSNGDLRRRNSEAEPIMENLPGSCRPLFRSCHLPPRKMTPDFAGTRRAGRRFFQLPPMSTAQVRGYCGIGIVLSSHQDWGFPGKKNLAEKAGLFGLGERDYGKLIDLVGWVGGEKNLKEWSRVIGENVEVGWIDQGSDLGMSWSGRLHGVPKP